MGLGQYDSLGEYCGPHTASSVFLVSLPPPPRGCPPSAPIYLCVLTLGADCGLSQVKGRLHFGRVRETFKDPHSWHCCRIIPVPIIINIIPCKNAWMVMIPKYLSWEVIASIFKFYCISGAFYVYAASVQTMVDI